MSAPRKAAAATPEPQAEVATEPAAEFFGSGTGPDTPPEPQAEVATEPEAAELTPAEAAAARTRADYVRALEEELDHVTRAGKSRGRIAGVKAELARARTEADGRSLPPIHEA